MSFYLENLVNKAAWEVQKVARLQNCIDIGHALAWQLRLVQIGARLPTATHHDKNTPCQEAHERARRQRMNIQQAPIGGGPGIKNTRKHTPRQRIFVRSWCINTPALRTLTLQCQKKAQHIKP